MEDRTEKKLRWGEAFNGVLTKALATRTFFQIWQSIKDQSNNVAEWNKFLPLQDLAWTLITR